MVPLLVYALTGGVLWWSVHLVGLSVLAPTSCKHGIGWTMNVATALTAVGALSALWASLVVRRDDAALVKVNGRSLDLGDISLMFNIISLALIVLEGAPVWFLSPCT